MIHERYIRGSGCHWHQKWTGIGPQADRYRAISGTYFTHVVSTLCGAVCICVSIMDTTLQKVYVIGTRNGPVLARKRPDTDPVQGPISAVCGAVCICVSMIHEC